ncbi:MAG: cobyric acid synthase [Alteromonadaceae bacterium]|jgi:cobyric acid synthase
MATLLIQGTTSDAGKSLMVTSLYRIFIEKDIRLCRLSRKVWPLTAR